jgi:hypothetical protein
MNEGKRYWGKVKRILRIQAEQRRFVMVSDSIMWGGGGHRLSLCQLTDCADHGPGR